MNPVVIRLLSQQLAAPQFNTPAEVVRHLCAVQAQEYRMMRWAVAMRTKKPSAKAFKDAFDSGSIIRLHLLRGTWQLVSAQDYWWMLDLFSPRAISVTNGWMSSNGIVITEKEYRRIGDILAQTAQDKGSTRNCKQGSFIRIRTKRRVKLFNFTGIYPAADSIIIAVHTDKLHSFAGSFIKRIVFLYFQIILKGTGSVSAAQKNSCLSKQKSCIS